MAQSARATILHADLDAFYASVEQLLDPSLRGRPVAVGRGVVLAASYEAKAFGLSAGMPGRRARQLCPGLVVVDGHFAEYQRLGDAVVEVLRAFTPLVERISIDEAFLDVGGAVHLFGTPGDIAVQVRRRVRDELGLPISVGVATTKHLAKVASQVAKPDGIVVVDPGRERAFLDPLPVELLWGVGPATRERLARRGVTTIGQLAATAPTTLQRLLGHAVGEKLGSLANNVDRRVVETSRRARSIGAQSAFGRRPAEGAVVRATLGFLADRVASRLRAGGHAARTITVGVRFLQLRSVSKSTTLPWPVASTRTLTDVAVSLVMAALADNPGEREITLLSVSTSQLVPATALQLALPFDDAEAHDPGTERGSARGALDRAMDDVRARFGRGAIGYAPVVFRADGGVPDEFRELAEAD